MVGLYGMHVRLQPREEMHDAVFPPPRAQSSEDHLSLSLSVVFYPLKDDGKKVRGLFQK